MSRDSVTPPSGAGGGAGAGDGDKPRRSRLLTGLVVLAVATLLFVVIVAAVNGEFF